MTRIAVVTPYFDEARSVLERCLDSVARQSVAADHILVADGRPQAWIEERGLRHIALDRSHGNYGNTPRAVGAILAMGEGYEAICFLDADNWLEPEHLEICLATAARGGERPCDYVLTQRILRRPDGSVLKEAPSGKDYKGDTNCFMFFPGAYHILPIWGTMPQELSGIGDRVLYVALRSKGLRGLLTGRSTVNYVTLFSETYRALGEAPPAAAKGVDFTEIRNWIDSLEGYEVELAERRTGVPLKPRPARGDRKSAK